jgi:hypothetical protein
MPGIFELEIPDFDQIRLEAGSATESAARSLWTVLNAELTSRRTGVRQAKETVLGKTVDAAPAASVNNYDTEEATVLHLTGSAAQDITGFRNGETGRVFWIHNTGSATYTVKHQNAGSVAANQIVTQSGSDVSVTTGKTIGFIYLSSKWREMKDA